MTTVLFKDWELKVDRVLTQLTYQTYEEGSENCGCNACLNFFMHVEAMFPEEILRMFHELGIDYHRPCEICHYGRQSDGLHFYGGWFHFKGSFSGKECAIKNGPGFTFDLTPLSDRFSIGFWCSSDLTFFSEKTNLVQIEFSALVPWGMDKSIEPE
jgi:hypothetical protein